MNKKLGLANWTFNNWLINLEGPHTHREGLSRSGKCIVLAKVIIGGPKVWDGFLILVLPPSKAKYK